MRFNTRLFRTKAFRLSLLGAGVYSLLSALGFGFIYWSTADHIQTQIDARLRLETEVLLDRYRTRALPALMESIQQRSRDDGQHKIFFYFLQGPGSERPGGPLSPWPDERSDPYATLRLQELFPGQPAGPHDRVRVLATRLPGGYRLLVGRDLNDEQQLLAHTLKIVVAVVAINVLLAVLVSVWLGRSTLVRIDAVSRTARGIIAGDLSRRIPVTGRDDEFDELGRRLNAMLERIEQLMAAMREVTDNVAHDLRSPLNRLRTRLEVTLLEDRSPAEYREVLEQAIADADGLLRTFTALLSIARAEAGLGEEDWATLDLGGLAEELAELYSALAEDKGVALDCAAAAGVRIQGQRQLLAQALSNLLDNAVKYTPPGGRVAVQVMLDHGAPTVVVADTGSGIPADQRERVLERFVRLDSARDTPGNGLGLSLVKAVAKRHGAALELDDNHPGLRVSLRFHNAPESVPRIAARGFNGR